MIWFILDILLLRKLGLVKPIRYALLTLILGCSIAGLVYAFVVFHALTERNVGHHVQPYSSN